MEQTRQQDGSSANATSPLPWKTKIQRVLTPPQPRLKQRIMLMVIFAVVISLFVFMFMPRTQFVDIASPGGTADSGEITTGMQVSQEVPLDGGSIKGLEIRFDTYERINRAEYTITLTGSDGQIITQAVFNADKIPMEGTFGIPIAETAVAAGDTATLTITTAEAESGNALGIYLITDGGIAPAQVDDTALDGSIALRMGYSHVSTDILAITAVLILLVCAAILFWSDKLYVNMFILVLVFGILFSLITPITDTPDEQQHVATAFLVADGQFFTNAAEGGQLAASYNDIINNHQATLTGNSLGGVAFDATPEPNSAWGTGVFFLWHLPSAIGLFFARLFGADLMGCFYAGRIASAIVYALFVFFAVKKAPRFKLFMAVLSIMPMTLMVAGSYNSDAVVYGISLLMGAYFIDMYFNDSYKISWKHIAVFALLMALVVMKKYTLGALALLPLFIPASRYADKKTKYLGALLVVGLAVLAALWQVKLMTSLSGGTSALSGDTVSTRGANMGQQLAFFMQEPVSATSIVYKSMMRDAGLNLTQLFNLGQMTYFPYEIFIYIYIAFLAVVAFSYTRYQYKPELAQGVTGVSLLNRFMILLVMVATVALTYLALYLSWTPVRAGSVEGVQGRYFLFMFFLLPFLGQNVWPVVGRGSYERAQLNIQFVAVLLAAFTLLTTVLEYY